MRGLYQGIYPGEATLLVVTLPRLSPRTDFTRQSLMASQERCSGLFKNAPEPVTQKMNIDLVLTIRKKPANEMSCTSMHRRCPHQPPRKRPAVSALVRCPVQAPLRERYTTFIKTPLALRYRAF